MGKKNFMFKSKILAMFLVKRLHHNKMVAFLKKVPSINKKILNRSISIIFFGKYLFKNPI
jgi:hypothetical protein